MFTTEALLSFLTLTGLETVLGIDNIIFIAILAGKLPPSQQDFARRLGLVLAVFSRIALLLTIGWVMRLKEALFFVGDHGVSGKDLVLILGGAFLIAKATWEIHHKVSGDEEETIAPADRKVSLWPMLAEVVAIDIVFSLDSVITAVGMTNHIPVMISAVIASVIIMLIFSGYIVRFVNDHPTIKMLALTFLLMIGLLLIAEGFHHTIPKGYVYFAMAFSLGIEFLNMWAAANKKKPVPAKAETSATEQHSLTTPPNADPVS